MVTLSEENYLKAIYHLERTNNSGVSTNALAAKMETKASSVSDMIRKLSDKSYVEYRKYQGVKLSKKGKKTAVEIIRKHRLWEVFLVEKLNFSWDEVHDLAEQLEHIKSAKLTSSLDEFLGFPERDPHGDPIPDAEGNFPKSDYNLLSELEKEKTAVIVGVKNSSSNFLQYLDRNNISPGKKIKILEKESFDQSVLVELEGKELQFSNMVANNLFIEKTENDG